MQPPADSPQFADLTEALSGADSTPWCHFGLDMRTLAKVEPGSGTAERRYGVDTGRDNPVCGFEQLQTPLNIEVGPVVEINHEAVGSVNGRC